jgi:cyclophilin family peptidyl-prolyl cis-trans isomerase
MNVPRLASDTAMRDTFCSAQQRVNGLVKFILLCSLSCLITLSTLSANADENSARARMSEQSNPLVVLFTSKGAIYFEFFAARAPRNVEQTLALIEGRYNFEDSDLQPRYYDQSDIYPAQTGQQVFLGYSALARYGLQPKSLPEEIDAASLGLSEQPLFESDGRIAPRLGITSRADFEAQILAPFYRSLNLNEAAVASRAEELWLQLKDHSVADALEAMGHRFTTGLGTQPLTAGSLALVSHPAGSASPAMLITLRESPWLDGRVTPIGRIVEGLEIAVALADSAQDASPARIYSMRVLAPIP